MPRPKGTTKAAGAAVQTPAKSPKQPVVRLTYDFWGEDGKRYRRGEKATVPVNVAKALIASNKAVRADPLPGEEDEN